MRISILCQSCCLLAAIAASSLAGESDASKSEIELIQQAIAEKGADWTPGASWVTELSAAARRSLCGAVLQPTDLSRAQVISLPQADELPAHFDWRKNPGNWVTPPKNQGNCGSCWDFAAVAQVEAWWKIVNDNPDSMIDLSEQFILSCADAGSCDGGDPELALQFVRATGVPLETCLRYQANDAVPCSRACSNWLDEAVRIPGCGYITIGDADIANIKNAILRQPLAANYVVYDDFFSYSTGVYEHAWGEVAGGHVILIIGWDDERECWICKNSWGMNWGETADFKPYKAGAQNGGYFRIKWGECEIGKNCLYIYDNLTGPALTTTPKQFDLQVATGDSLQESFTIHNLGQEPLEYWTSSWGGASFFHVDSFMAFDDLSWWCGDPQINGYQNGWLQFLDTPLLDLSGTSAPRLTWMGYWALEDTTGVAGYQPYDGWDGCNVWISDDGGTTFTVAEPLQPRFTSRNLWSFGGWWYMGDNIPGWGGSSGGWQEIQNDLSLYQHDSVVVRFAFASDAALATADDSQLNGFFVDEILVTDGEALLFANHGDENNGMRASGEIQEAADWLRTVDAAGFLPAGESAIAQLRISSRGLKPGNYLGRLIILSNDTTAAKYFLPVKLRVRKPAFDIGVRQARPISAQVPLFLELHPAVTIENQGFADAENFNLVCQAQVAGKVVYSDARSIASLAAGSAQTIAFTPLSFTELGRVSLTVALADAPDDNPDNDQVVSVFDISNAIDDFATETGNWHFGAGWAIDENEAHTSPGAARLTEAPSLDGCLTFLPALDLSNTQAATLKFWTRYETEQGKDICYVEASHDSLTWIKLDSLSGVQWPRWAQREVSLAAFVGRERERTWFRFHYVSDSVTLLRGVIIDDIEIYAEHPTAVQSAQDRTLPQAFSLSQNYPNPFNAGTTIEYALPRTTFVTLQVYNLRGEQVAALVAEQREAGVHRIRWDARELASGVYLYQLAAGEFLQSKKLILMR